MKHWDPCTQGSQRFLKVYDVLQTAHYESKLTCSLARPGLLSVYFAAQTDVEVLEAEPCRRNVG